MHGVIQQLAIWTYSHPQWAGLVLFIISLCETITIVGSIIPGSVIMIAVGTLIGAELLPYVPMILWAASGAVVGDLLNFILGYLLKDRLTNIWPFSVKQNWLLKGKTFFAKHGKKSVFFGRFVGPLRAFIPVTAGALHMPILSFIVIDALSALLWAATYVIPGIILGATSLTLPPDVAAHFIWYIFLLLTIVVLSIWVTRLFYLHISDVVKHALTCLWQYLQKYPKFNQLRVFLRHYRADHPRGQLTAVFMWCLLLISFSVLAWHAHYREYLTQLDSPVFHFLTSIRNIPIDKLMLYFSSFGDKKALCWVFLSVFAWFCYRRCWRAAFHWVALTVMTYLSIHLLKHGLHVSRPTTFKHSFSFPSGHATLATVLYGGIAYFTASRWPERARWLCYLSASIIVSLVCLSRLYLGAHWLSDVVGGVLLGSLCLLTIVFSYQRHVVQKIKPKGLLIVAVSTVILCTGIYFAKTVKQSLQIMRPSWPDKTIPMNTWWQNQVIMNQPYVLANRFGAIQAPINLQWASNLLTINRLLFSSGWHHPIPHNWAVAMQHPETSHQFEVHFKNLLFRDRKPDLLFIKPSPEHKSTLVLRLWRTNYQFDQYPNTLWVGLISTHPNNGSTTESSKPILFDMFLANINQPLDYQLVTAAKLAKQDRPIEATYQTDQILMIR